MELTRITMYLFDYDTTDAIGFEPDFTTDNPMRMVREAEALHGDNFKGYNIVEHVNLKLYENVIGAKDDGR